MSKSLLIVGAWGHGRSVLDIVRNRYASCDIGFMDDCREKGSCVWGIEVLGATEDIAEVYEKLKPRGVIIAIGDNWNRYLMSAKIRNKWPEIKFIRAIHPLAYIGKDAIIGKGSVVMPGAVIGPGTKIGSHCVVNTRASIDHDCTLGEFCSVAPGATLGGGVTIGDFSAICLGANVIEKTHIGYHSVIGAGSTVLSDIGDNAVAYGTPARKIRYRERDEGYLK